MRLREWRALTRFLIVRLWRADGYCLELTTIKYGAEGDGSGLQHYYDWQRFPIRDILQSHQQTFALITKELEHRPTTPHAPSAAPERL